MIYLLIAVWLLIGASGFIYWWIKDYDYTVNEIPLTLLCSLMGVFSFIIGYFVHSKGTHKVLLRKIR